jgi:hypothetical protein
MGDCELITLGVPEEARGAAGITSLLACSGRQVQAITADRR